ncbi:transporter [Flavobacteriaceae bacterium]|nr:transporter [Flavobacteriaceae bacterium]
MKNLILTLMGLASVLSSYGQNITDALRYSTGETEGTARFKSMSGAFGALGGDMSAVSINPAGSAIFNLSHGSLTLSSLKVSNDVAYGSNTQGLKDNSFDMNQIGAAFVFNNRNTESTWNKFVVSLFYEQLQNYDNQFLAEGTTQNSIGSYFTEYANGLRLDEITALPGETISQAYSGIGSEYGSSYQQAYLGYESFILEPADDTDNENTAYTSNIAAGDFYQKYNYASTGYNGKFSVNLGFQYDKNIYFGINLNSHLVNYERSTFFYEDNTNTGSIINEVHFNNTLLTTGEGFSLQLGSIVKVNDFIRLGLTYDSPTWMRLREETTQYLYTFEDATSLAAEVDPAVINVFPEYNLRTPAKITGSAAFIIGDTGLISIDYSRKDYSAIKFRSNSGVDFSEQNAVFSNSLKAANTIRIGGELRHKKFSYRGGYKMEQSPYKDTAAYGNLNGFSLGMGYDFGGSRLDLAYENSKREMDHQLFNAGNLNAARINTTNSNVSLTLSMSL